MGVSSSVILCGSNFCKSVETKGEKNENLKITIINPGCVKGKKPTKVSEDSKNSQNQNQNKKTNITIIINKPSNPTNNKQASVSCKNIIKGMALCFKEKEKKDENKLIFGCYKKNTDKDKNNGKDEEICSCNFSKIINFNN